MMTQLMAAVVLSAAALGAVCAQGQTAMAGIDHIPLAVRDLERAASDFERLGFAIKRGRQHGNGIRNHHIKFPDGSGLELISASAAVDALSAHYVRHLQGGDGAAFVSFHVRDTAQLEEALAAAGIESVRSSGLTTFKHPGLGFVFITADNRSPTDRPEHFAHANGAVAMSEVWIALDDAAPLRQLLQALGASARSAVVRVPEPTDGEIFELQNGRVLLVPGRYQLVPGRPIRGVVMSAGRASSGDTTSGALLPPSQAHGLWLAFR